ncbi:lipopolysaccharide biosynthesis protein [Marmoricola sp. RAF53]|uniref:lipopolysaccharide biosynthesis protein n=1 Tax=Marmoricola sp. RAF53 TaxID=3233059 RepID=UPI003F9B40E7
MAGAAYAGAAGFGLYVVVGRLYGAHVAGLFVEGVAVFTLVLGCAVAGADTAMIRATAQRLALGRADELPVLLRATAPVLLATGTVAAGGLWLAAPRLAHHLAPTDPGTVTALRALAAVLAVSAWGQACLHATRGYGSVRSFVLLHQLWLPTARLLLVGGAGVLLAPEPGVVALVVAWVAPLLVVDVVAVVLVLRRGGVRVRGAAGSTGEVAREFWSFSLPRGFAALFETGIVWVDVLVVGALIGPAAAGVYAAASRFVTTGTMAMEAMRLATAPQLAAAFARRDPDRAREILGYSTSWLVLLAWPVFLVLAGHASWVMSLLGDGFGDGALPLRVMAVLMLGYTALGNVNALLLMAGRSRWTATNTLCSLTVNVVLNLLLVPRIGLAGAALAWGGALLLDSALCTWQAGSVLGARVSVSPALRAGGVALAGWAVPGALVLGLGLTGATAFAVHLLVAVPLYAALVLLFRTRLQLARAGAS